MNINIISWIGFGVQIEQFINNIIYITVPRFSHNKDISGKDLAGEILAQQYKEKMNEESDREIIVKMKIRDEHWTPQKEEQAVKEIKKLLYGGL